MINDSIWDIYRIFLIINSNTMYINNNQNICANLTKISIKTIFNPCTLNCQTQSQAIDYVLSTQEYWKQEKKNREITAQFLFV